MLPLLLLRSALFLGLVSASQFAPQNHPTWTNSFPPFRIAGNLYYVGSEDLAAYLIVTPQGNILINSNLESSPAQIKKSIESLGFKYARHQNTSHQPWPL